MNRSSDTLGEDRLLDQVDTWLSSHTDAEPTLQLHKCAEWLARLCARVRQLERRKDLRADLQDEGFLQYAGSERAYEILALLNGAGLGKPGAPHGDTVVGMIQELIEREHRAEVASQRMATAIRAFEALAPRDAP